MLYRLTSEEFCVTIYKVMKMLRFIFPLSYTKKTPKSFFIALAAYLALYILAGFIPIGYVGTVISVYVFIGAGLLMVNYYKKPEDTDKKENSENE